MRTQKSAGWLTRSCKSGLFCDGLQVVVVAPAFDSAVVVNLEHPHDFQAEGCASDFEVMHSLNNDRATVRDECLDIDRNARNDLHKSLNLGSDGVDAAMDSSWAVGVDRVVTEES